MKIEYLVKSSKDLTKEEIRQFRVLLDKQGQVDSSEGKAERCQGLGVGKYITKILLAEIKNENAFATTEFDTKNPMYHILKSFGFVSMGEIYKGNKTKKDICLMVLTKN